VFASTGASAKEIMSRGGWKSVAIVVRYEHASDQRDALLAQALKPSSLQAFKPSSLQAFKPSRWATTSCLSRTNAQEIDAWRARRG